MQRNMQRKGKKGMCQCLGHQLIRVVIACPCLPRKARAPTPSGAAALGSTDVSASRRALCVDAMRSRWVQSERKKDHSRDNVPEPAKVTHVDAVLVHRIAQQRFVLFVVPVGHTVAQAPHHQLMSVSLGRGTRFWLKMKDGW
jgi:hypothetical protein